MRRSVLDTEYIRIPVSSALFGLNYDPTGSSVEFAFVAPEQQPVTLNWNPGSWETITDSAGQITYYAIINVGPNSSIILPAGIYSIWIRITTAQEIIVLSIDTLIVY